nr:MAG TPA: protein of unknown function (DUF771) [Caudoviricetes sp.]
MELVLLNDKVESTELDEQEEITLSQALSFISIGRTTFLKILAQNRPEIDAESNPSSGWCIYPSTQSGRYRIFKRRFRDWWANNPAKTIVRY